jgi:plastin-1
MNVQQHPEIITLMEENEDISKFVDLPPEENLLRWFNYHLKRAGHHRRVKNFSEDIKVSYKKRVIR